MFSQRKTVESMNLLNCYAAPCGGSCGQSNSKNVQVMVAEKRQTKDERTEWSEFSRLVQILDWSEFRTIGPNSERLVRIPNDWYEFRTNDEFDVAIALNVLT